jgi:hypothetical protein
MAASSAEKRVARNQLEGERENLKTNFLKPEHATGKLINKGLEMKIEGRENNLN